MRRAGLLVAMVALLAAWPGEARAIRVSLQANTDFPLDIGGRLAVELPARVRLSTSLGYLPEAYLRTANDAAVEVGAYSRDVADVIETGIESSLVWRTHAGWRPFPRAGFYVEAGYGLLALRGRATTAEALRAVTGLPPVLAEPLGDSLFEVRSTVHMLDVELGWEWILASRFLLRVGVGGAFTIAAHSEVDPLFPEIPLVTDAIGEEVADRFDETYRDWLHLPTVSVGVGFVF